MATAYESDGDLPVMSHSFEGASCHRDPVSSDVPEGAQSPSSGAITCMQGLYPKNLCCSNQEDGVRGSSGMKPRMDPKHQDSLGDVDNRSECCHSNGGDSSSVSNCQTEEYSEIVSVLSDYYNYVEHIKLGLLEQGKPIEQTRLSLQFLPCLEGEAGKQPIFIQSSPITRATDAESLVEGLKNISSWYNHGLMTHLFVSMVVRNGVRTIADHYCQTLHDHQCDKMSQLPAVSSGPQLPEDFEEMKVGVLKKAYDSYTLGEVMNIHESLAGILGLKSFVLLFQGIEKPVNGIILTSNFIFWVPKSLVTQAMTKASQNEQMMENSGIVRIQAQYETVTTTTRNKVNIKSKESGYETQFQSNTTEDPFSPFHSCKTGGEEEGEDEVFITEVSSDSLITSSGYPQTTSDTSSLVFGNATGGPTDTPIIAPPPGYSRQCQTSSLKLSNDHDDSCGNALNPEGLVGLRPQSISLLLSEGGKGINLDQEILQEIERQNSISSSPTVDSTKEKKITCCTATDSIDSEQPYIAMNPASTSTHHHLKINSKSPTSVCSSQLLFHTPPRAQSTPIKPQSQLHYQTRSPLIKAAPQSTSLKSHRSSNQKPRTLQTPVYVYHHYRNVPLSYTGIPNKLSSSGQQLPHRIFPSRPSGFIKRILIRSSESWPANLQMVVISEQEANRDKGEVEVKPGQRVTALYAKNNDVVVKTPSGDIGKVPYSFCRVSKGFYGVGSKTSDLASQKLYSISTLSIESHPPDRSSPIPIDMIAIKRHTARDQQRDELSVEMGDKVRLLYCDQDWIYGSLKTGRSGFIPRKCCRLGIKSERTLVSSGWSVCSSLFQSDFIFSLHKPPPRQLFNLVPPSIRKGGDIVMLMRNYIPPGTQALIRKGMCVKIIYREDQFNYVATISGSAFWIPAPYTVPAPKTPAPPTSVCGLNRSFKGLCSPLSPVPKFRSRANTVSSYEPEKGSPKKKVSFATENHLVFRQSMGSNPELSVALNDQLNCPSNAYSVIPTQRSHSNENLPLFMLLLCNDSPRVSKCGCFNF